MLPASDPEMFNPLCPFSALPIQIGSKWTGMIVLCLEQGPRRFNEIRSPLRGITSKVLTETLRAMQRDGLLARTAYPENPPRVEYQLTPLGRTLLPLIDAARAWSKTHLPALLAARQAHESADNADPGSQAYGSADNARRPDHFP
ncbi:winged helix-turn-helix transcriptional regulator [Micromonospora sp. NPDC003197]